MNDKKKYRPVFQESISNFRNVSHEQVWKNIQTELKKRERAKIISIKFQELQRFSIEHIYGNL
jgi:hypothetical protein